MYVRNFTHQKFMAVLIILRFFYKNPKFRHFAVWFCQIDRGSKSISWQNGTWKWTSTDFALLFLSCLADKLFGRQNPFTRSCSTGENNARWIHRKWLWVVLRRLPPCLVLSTAYLPSCLTLSTARPPPCWRWTPCALLKPCSKSRGIGKDSETKML